MPPSIAVTHEAGLLTVTLNRPEKFNALDQAAYRLLGDAAAFAKANRAAVGAVLLRGAGRCFSTGNDLADQSDEFMSDEGVRFRSRVVEDFALLEMPVVAAVHGYCLTGGLELALAADIILCSESARFGDTHAKFDLVSLPALTHRLPKRIGRARALEIWLTGRRFTGAQAVGMGLANICAPDAELDAVVAAFMADILAGSWRSLRGFKDLANAAETIALTDRVAEDLGVHGRMGPDTAARIADFRKQAG